MRNLLTMVMSPDLGLSITFKIFTKLNLYFSQESFDLQLVARNGHLHPHDDDDDRIYQ